MTHQQLYSETGYASHTRWTLMGTKEKKEGMLWGKKQCFSLNDFCSTGL